MKLIFAALLLTSFAAHATPMMSMKERLRLHMWAFGLEDMPVKKPQQKPQRVLPEEIERALRKI